MKKFLTVSLLVTKLMALGCFSLVGLLALTTVEAVQPPCHEGVERLELSQQDSSEECQTCLIAVESWSQKLIEVSVLELIEIVTIVPSLMEMLFEYKPVLTSLYDGYSPPPQVLYRTAFHLPQRVTVILS